MIDIMLAITSFSNTRTNLIPLIALAIGLDASFVSIWYILGSLLNNNSLKQSAINEIYQLFGNIIIVILIVFLLLAFSSIFYNSLQGTKMMNSTTIYSMCQNINSSSSLSILNPSDSGSGSSLLYSGKSGSFPGLCEMVKNPTTTTEKIDYPVATSAVILANLTNQTFTNLNYLFGVEAYIGFLSKLTPTDAICTGEIAPPDIIPISCVVPFSSLPILLFIRSQYTPLSGYSAIYSGLATLGGLITTAMESFTAQLLIIVSFIYVWPILLFLGLALRSVFFTRRIGGLFIALAVAFILFYPSVMALEYLSLNRVVAPTDVLTVNSTVVGSNVIAPVYNYTDTSSNKLGSLDFFVEPSIKSVAQSTSCWAGTGSGLILTESGMILETDSVSNLVDLYKVFDGGFDGDVGAYSLGLATCNEQGAISTLFASFDIYGIMGITAYLLPIFNIIIVISGVVGLSGMLGGDTNLAGLSRLL